ncbi:MAG: tetratricopeptide repeat protein [Chloroflexi bacterium]|nr:tetratricopeptide repeat protein [Chloroflexota bacterium]
MVEPLMVLLELRGEYLAAERLYAHTAAQLEDQNAPNQASEIILARVLTGQSWFCFRLAQFEQGRALSARAFSLLQKHDAWQHTAYPLLIGGANEFGAGNLAAAREMTASSVEVYRRSQDAFGIAGALNNLGQITTALGEFDAAENYLRASLEVARRAGIKMLQCSALENLGALEFQRGELVQAQRDLEECLTLARETGDQYETATTQNSLARVLVARGETQTAAALLQDAENTWRKLGDRWSLANTLLAAAQVQRALNQPLPAEGLYWSALETAHAINATTMVLNVLAGIAELRAARGEMDFARAWCAVIVQHPAAEAATRERAMHCFDEFTAPLDADAVQALRTRAAQRDLRTAVAQLLDERA